MAHRRNTTNDLKSFIMLPENGVADLPFHKIEERSSATRCAVTQVRHDCDVIPLAHERERGAHEGRKSGCNATAAGSPPPFQSDRFQRWTGRKTHATSLGPSPCG
jgi:hypothetical protein